MNSENFNKHQSETKDTVKRELHELNRATEIIKEEWNKDRENIRTKNQTEIQEVKSPFSQTKNRGRPLQQTRTSGRQNLRAQR
jgi:hypothetical protein